MAIYHLHCDIIGRSGGRSATAAAAYRATCKIEDRTTGEVFDYTKKEKALYFEILTNGDVPKWATDRAELWNSVEEKENRKNSQFCRSFDIALMKELSLSQNIELIRKWANENYVKRGLVADIAIHAPHRNADGTTNENLHAHILIPTRKMNSDGWAEKDREANDRDFLKQVRTSWADVVNSKFQRLGISEQIDERTLEEQGIDREPQQHIGAKATAMQRKGKTTERKKYKSEGKTAEPKKEISVSDDELKNALENDSEYLRLQELLQKAKAQNSAEQKDIEELKKWENRIQNMTPKEWQSFIRNFGESGLVDEAYGEYARNLKAATERAKTIWVEQNILSITQDFEKNFKARKADWESYKAKKPTPIAERPSVLKAILYNFKTDDGEVFSGRDYDKYRMKQQTILNKWEDGKVFPQSEFECAKSELKDCYDKKYSAVKTAIARHHPKLLERMREGIKDITKKLEEFRPVRAMVQAVKYFKPQKDIELKAWLKAQKQQRNRQRGQDNEYYNGY
uniref:MobA/MobL protein domain-containing protein n=1 Tax=uncultured prokaryote TaxID=198431 RepID=A0A0H5PWZ7_9ZZZZ|nr:hypothetical protein [uncultured prokaryote]